MKISTRSRYGLRLMIQLAGSNGKRLVPLREIAETQQISGKYLSRLVIQLRRNRLIRAGRGTNGGYTLTSKHVLIAFLILGGLTATSYGSSRLFYLEAQAVASYANSAGENEIFWYSMMPGDPMQKPSIGFDLLQRFSGEGGDWGILAIQARVSYDTSRRYDLEPQLYNAYFKLKTGPGDFWLGHNKPSFGFSSYLDNHGTLLQPLSMYGFGYDRDWGAGYYRDFESGNLALSATTGSGMPLYLRGNYMLSGRVSKGDLNQQNYNLGLSASSGKNLEAMGYHLMPMDPTPTAMIGTDAILLSNRWENRLEFIWSRKTWNYPQNQYVSDYVIFHRLTANLLDENRLKLEVQNRWMLGEWGNGMLTLAGSYQITADLALRSMVEIDDENTRVIAQLYWYHKI
ncbi:Rrf2 family transcriptional regulator [candidate division TA06 bacterium]|uniref:Rrf2 family transcriptional regulator n=1 Tax=candidate division TA06 bacterium TaxID=2250710 RepID=A0A933I7S1_UNCT6|nr:Rrf2 family transcriptional regulator [candidate division TA06 bacterium]